MALTARLDITEPILEYSTYQYNELPQTAAADSID